MLHSCFGAADHVRFVSIFKQDAKVSREVDYHDGAWSCDQGVFFDLLNLQGSRAIICLLLIECIILLNSTYKNTHFTIKFDRILLLIESHMSNYWKAAITHKK